MNEVEFRVVEIEHMIDQDEEDGHRIDNPQSYARKILCGSILNGGSYLARRSLEDMRPTGGHY